MSTRLPPGYERETAGDEGRLERRLRAGLSALRSGDSDGAEVYFFAITSRRFSRVRKNLIDVKLWNSFSMARLL